MTYIPSNTIRMPGSFFDAIPVESEEPPVPLPLAQVLRRVDELFAVRENRVHFDLFWDWLVPARRAM